jgi:adenylosuccinate lyase
MLLLAARSKRKVWAQQLCHNIALSVGEREGDLVAAMSKNAEVLKYLSPAEIRAAADPTRYMGTAVQQVNGAAAVCKRKQANAANIFARTVSR